MYGILLYDIRSTDASVFLYQPLLAHMPSPGRMYNGPSPKTQELPAFEKIQVGHSAYPSPIFTYT